MYREKRHFFMDSRLLLSGMTKKEENGFFLWIATKFFSKIFRNDGKGNGNGKDKTDEKQSGCCHCEPVRVWQSMENKKQQ